MEITEFESKMKGLREDIASLVLRSHAAKEGVTPNYPNVGEVMANVTLALRHLEDAAMRFGKAIQSATTGMSPLGGPATPGQSK